MSTQNLPDGVEQRLPENYTGPERYWQAAEDWFDITLSPEQRTIHEHVATNQYTHLEGGNGFGKTFGIVGLALSFHKRHYPSSVVVTSGTYGKLKRTFCADAEGLHQNSPLFGEWKWSPNPHIDIADEPTWQFEVISPEDPGELEGVHNDHVLVIVDEADKKDVDLETLDSMDSLISDRNDRMVIISNPPEDETNAVANMGEIGLEPEKLQFSTFDSHNVHVELGRRDGDRIPGLTGLHKLKKKWEAHNGESWPGYDEARAMSLPGNADFRKDLNTLWYRRFAGIMPPAGATKNRPIQADLVTAGYVEDTNEFDASGPRCGTGLDVARSGDRTVQIDERDGALTIEYSEPGTDHTVQFNEIWNNLDAEPEAQISGDAVGEGSGKLDDTARRFPNVDRFKAGETAVQSDEYKDRWTEGLVELGKWLERGGEFTDTRLRKELKIAAREITLSETYIKSRDEQVYVADPKDDVKDRLGHSPDHLDAAIMAISAAEGLQPEEETGPSGSGTW
ncbi:hypothetical protein [Halosimplex pelagicum]|uniref:Terminase n=1 Tax=Halosimplex pelagicum TaxID=869886 RepID=A0A7D5T5P7_9EURY|nr:hypothetical protein [Halosimplex pelagicum]QLH82472.1 hypothetical protein HZS54_12980 [Halosimplex pelagicum]QLH82528.1 hypothetical protein HZS54_13285 [Halosimplex pelagicum]